MKFVLVVVAAFFIATPAASLEADCRPPSIGLVLGSGGAGGLAHIAMLGVFEDLELQPAAMAGTSIGAVVAALYAAGLSASEIQDLFRDFGGSALDPLTGLLKEESAPGWSDLLEIDLAKGSFIDARQFIRFIAERFDQRLLEQLEIPLQIVATDYWTGEAHVFRSGDLLQAIQASMAVPGLFAPVALGEQLLIDGGASNPLPVDLLEGLDIVVAIDVTGTRDPNRDGTPGITDLLFSTFEIMQQSILCAKLEHQRPEIHIKPELAGVRLLHFDRVDAIVEQAKPAAAELRRQLRAHLGDWQDCRSAAADGNS